MPPSPLPTILLRPIWRSALLSSALFLSGCLSGNTPEAADREVYQAISDNETKIFGHASGFKLDAARPGKKTTETKAAEIVNERSTTKAVHLDLPEALALAVKNNREYQNQKESLYLTALNLTGERHAFAPQFFATSSSSNLRNSDSSTSAGFHSQVGLDQLLKSGGRIAVRLANDLLRYYSGNAGQTTTSVLSINILQPLLRGSGADIVGEKLTQAERDVIYAIRDYSRFQQNFAVGTATDYWRCLQLGDTLRNEQNNFKNVTLSRERAEALSIDRLPLVQVDQARQDELRAKNRVIQAEQRLKESLDDYKNRLALPQGGELTLDPQPLADLTAAGLTPVMTDSKRAFEIAVSRRLDLLNEIDRFEDAKRQVKVAADDLRPGLNLVGGASLQNSDPTNYSQFNINDFSGTFGADIDLPLDRVAERNHYRAALVNVESRARSLAAALDDLRHELRTDLRNLNSARESYEIQSNARTLADRRVEAATILLQAGRAQIRDLLEAQNAQINAQNDATSALINYHTNRLAYLYDMGVLNTDQPRFWISAQAVSGYHP